MGLVSKAVLCVVVLVVATKVMVDPRFLTDIPQRVGPQRVGRSRH